MSPKYPSIDRQQRNKRLVELSKESVDPDPGREGNTRLDADIPIQKALGIASGFIFQIIPMQNIPSSNVTPTENTIGPHQERTSIAKGIMTAQQLTVPIIDKHQIRYRQSSEMHPETYQRGKD
jgi:hypothetical protein